MWEFSDFFAQCHTHIAEDLPQGFKEGIAEGLNAEGVDAADALRLNQAALDAGNHRPDVAEGDAGEQEAPEQSHGDAEDSRQNAVAPVLGHGEGGVAELPYTIQAVCTVGLCDDVLKLHLIRNSKEHLISTLKGHTSFNLPPDTKSLCAAINQHMQVVSVEVCGSDICREIHLKSQVTEQQTLI